VFAPPIYVDIRTAPRSRYGLIDAADEVVPEDSKWINGIEYNPACRLNATVYDQECNAEFAFDLGENGDGIPTVQVAPIRMYAGFICRSMSLTQPEIDRQANDALDNSSSAALERLLWTPPDDPAPAGPSQLRLMGPDTVILNAGDPVGFVAAVRILEDYLVDNYGRVGVIHARAGLSAEAGHRGQIRWENAKPVTQRGTRWSWGAYGDTGPDGDPVAAGTAWMVATGAVGLRQTKGTAHLEFAEILDRTTNEVFAVASKTFVVAWECVTAAVLVTLET
jgi:hypothetical protein